MRPIFVRELTEQERRILEQGLPQDDPGGDPQPIAFSWTQQTVDTVNHICLALDELVTARVAELEVMLAG